MTEKPKTLREQRAETVAEWFDALLQDSAGRAKLRRSASLLDAAMEQAVSDLLRKLGGPRDPDPTLVVAMTLAHRREPRADKAPPFAVVLGRTEEGLAPGEDQRGLMSPTRFGALLRAARARDYEALARHLRRTLALLDKRPFDVGRLGADLLTLSNPAWGDRTLRDWAFQYWQSDPPATADDAPPQDNPETAA